MIGVGGGYKFVMPLQSLSLWDKYTLWRVAHEASIQSSYAQILNKKIAQFCGLIFSILDLPGR